MSVHTAAHLGRAVAAGLAVDGHPGNSRLELALAEPIQTRLEHLAGREALAAQIVLRCAMRLAVRSRDTCLENGRLRLRQHGVVQYGRHELGVWCM